MLTQTAKHALRAVGYIAIHAGNQPILSQTISRETQIPQNFLSKIMHRLVKASYLTSKRGANGGFKLTRDPKEISLYEIVELFMNTREFTRCLLRNCDCDGSCKIHHKQQPINARTLELLRNTTIDKIS